MTALRNAHRASIFPPEWVFEPWAGGGGGRWRNGWLQDIALEQMAAMKNSMNSIFRIPAFYAEGAGATFYGEYKKRNYTKLYRLENVMDSRVFSWQFLI